jgi:hypothetical protein
MGGGEEGVSQGLEGCQWIDDWSWGRRCQETPTGRALKASDWTCKQRDRATVSSKELGARTGKAAV